MKIFQTLCREFRAVTGRGAPALPSTPARPLATAHVLYGDGVLLPRRETVPMSPELGAWLQSSGVIRSDGTFCIKQAMLELADFQMVLGEVGLVYDALTSGTISKVTTHHKHVIARVQELHELTTQEAVAEATADLVDELATARELIQQVEGKLLGVQEQAARWAQMQFDGWMGRAKEAEARVAQLEAAVNTPHTDDFLQAVQLEAVHQRLRWSTDHDAGKADSDWFWLIGYLAGKVLRTDADLAKKLHHVITTAAVCLNWHANLTGASRAMRPGIAPAAHPVPA